MTDPAPAYLSPAELETEHLRVLFGTYLRDTSCVDDALRVAVELLKRNRHPRVVRLPYTCQFIECTCGADERDRCACIPEYLARNTTHTEGQQPG